MSNIIGIIFGKKNTPWQRIDADGGSLATDASSFNDHPIYAGIADEVVDGQHMVRIPAFYYRAGVVASGEHEGLKAAWISDQPTDGFSLHPAFKKDGEDLAQMWVGKYQGTPDGEKLGSQPGLKPLTRIDFPAMQQAAQRGDGFQLWSIYHLAAIQMLALIELGTADAQSVLGSGHVNGGGALPVDDATVAQATWRGIVGLWGNVWQMVDGLQTDENLRYRIWDAEGRGEYVSTGAKAPDGWIHRRHNRSGEGFDLGAVFLPKKTRENREDSAYRCYTWAYSNAVAYHGGSWGYGSDAGLFLLNVVLSASVAGVSVGGRLAKV
ncbi:hypothetical protein FQZ97_679830 [compost metagenome]